MARTPQIEHPIDGRPYSFAGLDARRACHEQPVALGSVDASVLFALEKDFGHLGVERIDTKAVKVILSRRHGKVRAATIVA